MRPRSIRAANGRPKRCGYNIHGAAIDRIGGASNVAMVNLVRSGWIGRRDERREALMEVPKYLQILWGYKWLILFGALVSIVAGVLAGFTIADGELEPRVKATYTSSTTVLLSPTSPKYYQTEVPSVVVDPLVETTPPVEIDLSNTAKLYAYLVGSSVIRDGVEAIMGPLFDDEQITGRGRTAQPGEDLATTTTKLNLPLLDVIGVSTSGDRADLISTTANEVFQKFVLAQQDAIAVAPELRVVMTTLGEAKNDGGTGANAAIPVAVTFLGSMIAFIALAYLLYAGQTAVKIRQERKAQRVRRKGKAQRVRREGKTVSREGKATKDEDRSGDAGRRRRQANEDVSEGDEATTADAEIKDSDAVGSGSVDGDGDAPEAVSDGGVADGAAPALTRRG